MKCFRTIRTSETLEHSRQEFWFLEKLWRLYFDGTMIFTLLTHLLERTKFKIIHKTIKKVAEDIEGFSFNTSVSVYDLCE
jgi:leucyl-tRNA synthetase